MSAEQLALFNADYLAYLRWCASHASELPEMIELCSDVLDAHGPGNKCRATSAVLLFVAPIADDFPTASTFDAAALSVAEGEVTAAGIDLGKLKSLWPVFQLLLPILLDRLKAS